MDYLQFYKEINVQKQINKLAKKYKNQKIIVYGAGLMSRILFQNFDLSCLNIVGVADSKYTKNSTESFWGHKTMNPVELKDFDFDVILIAVKEKKKILENIKYNILINTKNEDKEVKSLLELPVSFMIKQILF